MSKKVIIDLRGALLALERTKGVKKNVTDVSKEYDLTSATLRNWDKQTPMVVNFIFQFLKNTGCKFEDLVKESN